MTNKGHSKRLKRNKTLTLMAQRNIRALRDKEHNTPTVPQVGKIKHNSSKEPGGSSTPTVPQIGKVTPNSNKEPHRKEHKLNLAQKGARKRHTQHITHTQTDNIVHTQIHNIEKILDKTPHIKVQVAGEITHLPHRATIEGKEIITVHVQIKKDTKM